MTRLTHAVTGHQLETDDKSVDFWKAAGYAPEQSKAPAKKAPAKKSAPSKSSK